MLVGNRMTHPVITVHPETSMEDALNLMHKEHIRRLPVVDKRGKLVGIVSERQILKASPSDMTTLSVWEMKEMASKITVEKIMTTEVVTVEENSTLEEAARMLVDNKIGALPVMKEGKVVGIITETDLFKIFLEVMGARTPGLRITVLATDTPGLLSKISSAIFEAGGNIIASGSFLGESSEDVELTFKANNISKEALVNAVKPYVIKMVDVREMLSA